MGQGPEQRSDLHFLKENIGKHFQSEVEQRNESFMRDMEELKQPDLKEDAGGDYKLFANLNMEYAQRLNELVSGENPQATRQEVAKASEEFDKVMDWLHSLGYTEIPMEVKLDGVVQWGENISNEDEKVAFWEFLYSKAQAILGLVDESVDPEQMLTTNNLAEEFGFTPTHMRSIIAGMNLVEGADMVNVGKGKRKFWRFHPHVVDKIQAHREELKSGRGESRQEVKKSPNATADTMILLMKTKDRIGNDGVVFAYHDTSQMGRYVSRGTNRRTEPFQVIAGNKNAFLRQLKELAVAVNSQNIGELVATQLAQPIRNRKPDSAELVRQMYVLMEEKYRELSVPEFELGVVNRFWKQGARQPEGWARLDGAMRHEPGLKVGHVPWNRLLVGRHYLEDKEGVKWLSDQGKRVLEGALSKRKSPTITRGKMARWVDSYMSDLQNLEAQSGHMKRMDWDVNMLLGSLFKGDTVESRRAMEKIEEAVSLGTAYEGVVDLAQQRGLMSVASTNLETWVTSLRERDTQYPDRHTVRYKDQQANIATVTVNEERNHLCKHANLWAEWFSHDNGAQEHEMLATRLFVELAVALGSKHFGRLIESRELRNFFRVKNGR